MQIPWFIGFAQPNQSENLKHKYIAWQSMKYPPWNSNLSLSTSQMETLIQGCFKVQNIMDMQPLPSGFMTVNTLL